MVWLSPEVRNDLIFWKNPQNTGFIFGSVLIFLLAVKYVSVISVFANLCLALVTATMLFRIYKRVLTAFNKTQEGHPFKNLWICYLRKIFLVEDLIQSLKFALAMYLLTYVGGFFNGLTVIITGWVATFSIPRLYRDNQAKFGELKASISPPAQPKKEE